MISIYKKDNTDFTTNGDAVLIPLSCKFKATINGSWQLELTHPYDPEERYKLIEEDAVIRVELDCIRELSNAKQLYRVSEFRKEMNSVVAVAYPRAMESTFDAPVDNLVVENKTAVETMALLQDFTDKYTLYTDCTGTDSASWGNTNINNIIAGGENSFIDIWGGEILYDNTNYKVLSQLGDDTAGDHIVRYGRNLKSIKYSIDDLEVCTRLRPISQDGIRLDGTGNVDSPKIDDYPVIKTGYITAPYSLVEDNEASPSRTAQLTRIVKTNMNTVTNASTLASYANVLATGCYPEYVKSLKSAILSALQTVALTSVVSASERTLMANAMAQGVKWMDNLEAFNWQWEGDWTNGWKYGDGTTYATSRYLSIDNKWEYFDEYGNWVEKKEDSGEWGWYQPVGASGRKYGNFTHWYAQDEWVYEYVDDVLTCYWIGEDGWYYPEYTKASTWTWHGSGSQWWFGIEGATAGERDNYAHDQWIYINGYRYWFDHDGYCTDTLGVDKIECTWHWVVSSENGWWWFGEELNGEYMANYLTSQWCYIDNAWYYFNEDGYTVTPEAAQQMVIDEFVDGATTIINRAEMMDGSLYSLLYDLMTEYCEKQFELGIDTPVVNIKVDMVDLSKTQEYKDFIGLEKICLGDTVTCTDYEHDISVIERVVALEYDCINQTNTSVTIGTASKTVKQILTGGTAKGEANKVNMGFDVSGIVDNISAIASEVTSLNTRKQDKLIAGQNITISNNVISANGVGLRWWKETSNRFYREGVKEDTIHADDHIETSAQWSMYVGGLIWGCDYHKINNTPAIIGWSGAQLNKHAVLISTDADAVKWQYKSRSIDESWKDMSEYPYYNQYVSFEYNGGTWYASVIEAFHDNSASGTIDGIKYITNITTTGESEEKAIDFAKAILDYLNARDYINIVTEIGIKNYVLKYGGDGHNYVAIDTDGNAFFKEISTERGNLSDLLDEKGTSNVKVIEINHADYKDLPIETKSDLDSIFFIYDYEEE